MQLEDRTDPGPSTETHARAGDYRALVRASHLVSRDAYHPCSTSEE
jgi:hypothetical protein